MATAPDLMLDEEPEEPIAAEGLMLQDILQPGVNLADMLEPADLAKIGQDVIRDVEIDRQSRKGWFDRYERNVKIAMQVKEPKNFPWPDAASAKSPILTVASIQFNAEAYPIIVDGSNLVRGRVLGPDPDGQKRAKADRIGAHMTWQLLYRMPGWDEGTDKLLLMLPIVGNEFRKVYYDSIENANRSEIVSAEDFIINNAAKSIETAPRYTQVLHYHPYEVAEFVAAGLWKEVAVESDEIGEDEQALVDFYEQHRCIDLDEDGYPEHYAVTCTVDGEVARIAPIFGIEDITAAIIDPQTGRVGKTAKLSKIMEAGQQEPRVWEVVGDIVRIERRQYFVKYGFLPSPDGSFYDIGFGDLLENVTGLINTLQNQMLDAATLANAQGGFLGSGVNVRGGNFKFASVGEWKRVDTQGGNLRDNILPLSLPGPSTVSFSLLELLMQSAKDITASQDVIAGRAPANQPATTTLALIEQAGTVRKGIFKRIHRSFGQELRILRRLNRDFLDEEEYFQLNDDEEAVKIGREDYADEDLDVIPVSDPSQISDLHKMARAEAIMQTFNGDPLVNQKLIRQNMLEAMGARDVKAYFEVPEPQPDPALLVEMGKLDIAKNQAKSTAITARAAAAERFAAAAERLAKIGLLEDAAALAAESVDEGIDEIIQETPNEPAGGQGSVPGMEGPAPDPSLSGLPEGAPIGPDGGMGQGGDIGPGAPGPGSFAGAPGGPEL
jgi:chaperonin GroES